MKKYISFLLSIIIVLMASCGEKNAYTITGTVESDEYEKKIVYLQVLDTDFENRVNIDSTYVTNGKFKFTGVVEEGPNMGFILFKDKGWAPLIIESGSIKINIGKTMESSFVKGTPMNDAFFALVSILDKESKPDSQLLYDYIKGDIQNQVGVYCFTQIADALSIDQKKELLAAMAPEFENNERIKKIKEQVQFEEAVIATAIGTVFTDLKAKDPEGKAIALSDFAGQGNYVLVDFWASWCPPCRKEMPRLVSMYKKYKGKGLEIVGVSLDKDIEAWKNGIKKLNITWPQISDLKHWDSSLSRAYGVNGIPHLVLINKDGTIIERGLNAEEMEAKLIELIK